MVAPALEGKYAVLDGTDPRAINLYLGRGQKREMPLEQEEIRHALERIEFHAGRQKGKDIPNRLVGVSSVATDEDGRLYLNVLTHHLSEGAVILVYDRSLDFVESLRAPLAKFDDYVLRAGEPPRRGATRSGYMRASEIAVVGDRVFVVDARGKVAFYDR